MGEVVAFKYGDLDADTSGFIREAAGRIRVRLARSSQDIIEIGLDLTAVKSRIGHGNFLPWVKTEFQMSERSAANFIRAADKFSSKIATIANLPATAVYELAYADADTTAEIEQRSQAGEAVTTAIIKELRAKNKKLREERDIARLEEQTRTGFAEETSQKLHEATCEVQYLTKEIERITSDNVVEAKVVHDDAPLRQALMGFWRQLPQKTQEWFLDEVTK